MSIGFAVGIVTDPEKLPLKEKQDVGAVGLAPPGYPGTATLASIPAAPGLTNAIYSTTTAELYWPGVSGAVAGVDKYEVVIDGIIVSRDGSHSFTKNDWTPGAHTWSVRLVRDDGLFGDEISASITMGDFVSTPDSPVYTIAPYVESAGATSAVIRFTADQQVQAYLELSLDGSQWNEVLREESFEWAGHRQTPLQLTTGTLYYYRATIISTEGVETTSSVGTFTTDTVETNPLWPTGVSSLLPHGGLAMGIDSNSCIRIGNLNGSLHVGVSIICQTDESPIDGIMMETRQVAQSDLNRNYEPWKTLKSEGWPKQIAGWYAYGMYTAGNCTLYAEARYALEGSIFPDMSPAGLVVAGSASLAESFHEHYDDAEVFFELPSSFTAVKGKRYCLLLLNVDPPPSEKLEIKNKAEAAQYQLNHPKRGRTGPNGAYISDVSNGNAVAAGSPRISPIWGDSGAVAIGSNSQNASSWSLPYRAREHYPFIGPHHEDGKVRAPLAYDYLRQSYQINGSNKLRYRFTADYNFPTNTLKIAFSHNRDTATTGQPMTVQLYKGSTLLATRSISADSALSAQNRRQPNKTFAPGIEKWVTLSIPQMTITQGSEYTIVLSANNGGRFSIYMRERRFAKDADYMNTVVTEYSTGGGWSAVTRASAKQSGGWLFMHQNVQGDLPIPEA